MEYLGVDCARQIVQRIQAVPVFYPGVGAKCPLCGGYTAASGGEKCGRRYHRCDECGHRYPSVLPE